MKSVRCDEDVERVMEMWGEFVKGVRLWEFYVVDVGREVQRVREVLEGRDGQGGKGNEGVEFEEIVRRVRACFRKEEGTRYPYRVDITRVCSILVSLPKEDIIPLYKRILEDFNLERYKEYDTDLAAIHENIRNRMRFLRVMEHGPRLVGVSREEPIVDTYFTRLYKGMSSFLLGW